MLQVHRPPAARGDPGPVRAVDHPVRVRPPAPGRPRRVAPRPARDARAASRRSAPSSGSTSRSGSSTSSTWPAASRATSARASSTTGRRRRSSCAAVPGDDRADHRPRCCSRSASASRSAGSPPATRRAWTDGAVTVISLLGISIPIFVLGLTLQYIFAVQLKILPAAGRIDPRLRTSRYHTNFVLIDTLLAGNPEPFVDALQHLILPAIALGSIPLAIITRITRASVLDVDQRGLRPDGPGQGPDREAGRRPPHHAQRLAAGRDRHRPAGRRAARRRRHHRDRVRLERASAAGSSRRSRTTTTSSSSRRS